MHTMSIGTPRFGVSKAALTIGFIALALMVLDALMNSGFAQATGDAVFTNLTNKATDFFY